MREECRLQIKVITSNYQSSFEEEINKFLLEVSDPSPKILYEPSTAYNYYAIIEHKTIVNKRGDSHND